MLITGHIRQIVQACHPESREEAIELWHNIRPIKFGNRLAWPVAGGSSILAQYQVPEDAAYLLILKTECYVFQDQTTAANRLFQAPPGATAQWTINTGAGPQGITGLVPIHLLAEASEFLMVKAGVLATLIGVLSARPDLGLFIRTIVYAYHVNAIIADRIGTDEALVVGLDT
jgi:hypothetical protein